ncbi:hypothetical protein COV18_05080 [Candidatus Woesearchaeota archaeon CG10_big_fil_rev_8_21_14_0_10_37_12]|nr:MAG: hypothetical protein COV18_05080 [Candidatus Woesearchaeota archaeon CG10_big_fil_rev_8_21_14_0_10_37_12]
MNKQQLLGSVLLLIGLLPVLSFLLFLKPHYIVWFSNHTFIILGLAVLFGSRFWVFAELCIGFIPELIWSIDFLMRLFTGEYLFGITTYMFTDAGTFNWIHLYSLQHILFLPLGLYALYILGGPIKQAWIGSGIHYFTLYPLSFFWGTEYNLNCLFYSCGVLSFLPEYQLTWPLLMAIHLFLIYWFLLAVWKK